MKALQKEQFAAKVRELQLAGNKEGAEALLKLNSVYEAAGPEMASAFQASVTGNLSNADAQKANLASNGEMIRTTQQVIAGQISYQEAAQRTGKEMGNTADTVGTTLGQLGAYNDKFGNLSEQLKLAQMANGDIVANSAKIQADQKAQIAGADPLVKGQTAIVEAQIKANKAMTDFVFEGIVPAQEKMRLLAEATGLAARGLADVVGGKAIVAGGSLHKGGGLLPGEGAQRARLHVDIGAAEGVFQHAGDVIVRQAIGGLDLYRRFDSLRLFASGDRQQTIGINLKHHANARRACSHRRNPTHLEARQRATVCNQFAFTLHHMQGHRGLAILERREFLSTGCWDGRVARENPLNKPPHRLETRG
jgi:hypothetical protein